MTQIIQEEKLKKHVGLTQENLKLIEEAFVKLSQGLVTMPPIMRIDVPEHHGEVDVKAAYIHGLDAFVIKLSSGFFENYKLNLPTGSGLMVLMSAQTGQPVALLLDNGYLTNVRTALAGAVAAKYLAPQAVETVGVVGSGTQARYQLQALTLVREFKHVIVYSKTKEHAQNYAKEMQAKLNVMVTIADSVEQLVKKSQIVVTTTPSTKPLIQPQYLHPALHITAMGSDAEHKNEIAPTVFSHLDVVVCDHKKQCLALGELHHVEVNNLLGTTRKSIIELGELCAGKKMGRKDDSEITLCDLTGTGAQDTAIGLAAWKLFSRNPS